MPNLFDQLKVEDVALLQSPVADGGAALLVKFKETVEIDGDGFAFPLTKPQMIQVFKLIMQYMADEKLLEEREKRIIVV